MAEPHPRSSNEPAPAMERGLGWSLGVLLRAYEASVRLAIGEVPHGHRGYQVLSEAVHGEPPSQLALAARLGIDRTVMTYLIDDLVEAGLVERRPNPGDRRQRLVEATKDGRRRLRALERRVRAAEDSVLQTLSPAEREAFCGLVQRVATDVADVDTHRDVCAVAEDWVGPT